MLLVKPEIELLRDNNDRNSHVARCARICYGKSDEASTTQRDVKLVDDLLTKKHYSMFRHATYYYIIPRNINLVTYIGNAYSNCSYVDWIVDEEFMYLVINGNFILDHRFDDWIRSIKPFNVSIETFKDRKVANELIRYTFRIVTQISTSRELNRTSPNNIAERSTRYVNYNKRGDVVFCMPHWFDIPGDKISYEYNESIHQHYFTIDGITHPWENVPVNVKEGYNQSMVTGYCYGLYQAEHIYNDNIKAGMQPQDARGNLPLDTVTECVYTYSVKEWRHILDLRYYGTTGKPHENAKLIAGLIRNKLISQGYEFR